VSASERGKTHQRNMASNIFAVLAVIFAVLAVVLYLRPGGGGIAPIPTAAPGKNQIVNVTEALKAQGLDIVQPPGLFVPRGALAVPGQGIDINGQPGFVFIFDDAAAAQAAATSVNPDAVVPARLAGTPAPPGERRTVQGSNVVVLLIDGDAATWQKVQDAVASLF
jgi:hypothetical protein